MRIGFNRETFGLALYAGFLGVMAGLVLLIFVEA